MSDLRLADSRSVVTTALRAAGCVFAEDEARLLVDAATTPAVLAALVDRRAAGQPLEHVLGWADFLGLRIPVGPGVFVPRRRTELLVRAAAAVAGRAASADAGSRSRPPPVVVDLCCGAGAVGAALMAVLGSVELHAVDIDPTAVRCARRNLTRAGGQAYEGDLYEPLPTTLQGRVDVLVASAPYVPTDAVGLLPAEARLHEPRIALDGGPDGLDVVRRLIALAPGWLRAGGHLLVETSEGQAAPTVEAAVRAGLVARVAGSAGLDATVVIGRMPEK